MKMPDELLVPFSEDVVEKTPLNKDHKFLDHNRTLDINWTRIHNWIPEYLTSETKIVDISCGNGATLEVLRYYKCDYLGVDINDGYIDLLQDKKLNYIKHDCSKSPYPFTDQQFDVLINYGAITFYGDLSVWPAVLSEFERITKKCILLGVNVGGYYDNGGDELIKNWISQSNFVLNRQYRSTYKLLRK